MIGTITTAWTDVMDWVTGSLGSVQAVFYAENSLTFLGTLAVIGVAMSGSLLLINIISNFIKLRG